MQRQHLPLPQPGSLPPEQHSGSPEHRRIAAGKGTVAQQHCRLHADPPAARDRQRTQQQEQNARQHADMIAGYAQHMGHPQLPEGAAIRLGKRIPQAQQHFRGKRASLLPHRLPQPERQLIPPLRQHSLEGKALRADRQRILGVQADGDALLQQEFPEVKVVGIGLPGRKIDLSRSLQLHARFEPGRRCFSFRQVERPVGAAGRPSVQRNVRQDALHAPVLPQQRLLCHRTPDCVISRRGRHRMPGMPARQYAKRKRCCQHCRHPPPAAGNDRRAQRHTQQQKQRTSGNGAFFEAISNNSHEKQHCHPP